MSAVQPSGSLRRCSRCRKHKLVHEDKALSEFHAAKRDENGQVLAWHSRCKQCCREVHHERYVPRTRHARPGCQPAEPLLAHLRSLAERYETRRALAASLGISEDRLRVLLRGTYWHGRRIYPIRHVSLELADRILTHEGSATVAELWPEAA